MCDTIGADSQCVDVISGLNGVTPKADRDSVIAALGRATASAPEATGTDAYHPVLAITDPAVSAHMKSLANGAVALETVQGSSERGDCQHSTHHDQRLHYISGLNGVMPKADRDSMMAALCRAAAAAEATGMEALHPAPAITDPVVSAHTQALVNGAAALEPVQSSSEHGDCQHSTYHEQRVHYISGLNGARPSMIAALSRAAASAAKVTGMDAYHAVSVITDPAVSAHTKSLVKGTDTMEPAQSSGGRSDCQHSARHEQCKCLNMHQLSGAKCKVEEQLRELPQKRSACISGLNDVTPKAAWNGVITALERLRLLQLNAATAVPRRHSAVA